MAQDDRGAETDERRADRALGLFWGELRPLKFRTCFVDKFVTKFVAQSRPLILIQ